MRFFERFFERFFDRFFKRFFERFFERFFGRKLEIVQKPFFGHLTSFLNGDYLTVPWLQPQLSTYIAFYPAYAYFASVN